MNVAACGPSSTASVAAGPEVQQRSPRPLRLGPTIGIGVQHRLEHRVRAWRAATTTTAVPTAPAQQPSGQGQLAQRSLRSPEPGAQQPLVEVEEHHRIGTADAVQRRLGANHHPGVGGWVEAARARARPRRR